MDLDSYTWILNFFLLFFLIKLIIDSFTLDSQLFHYHSHSFKSISI